MVFCFKITKNVTVMTEDDEEDYRKNNICIFCEKEIVSDKVRKFCHLTGKYRGPAHYTCKINVEFEIIPKTNEEYIYQ